MATRILRIAMTKARVRLGELVRTVHVDGDAVVLEKDGIPVAALIGIDAFEDYLEARDTRLRRKMRESMKAHRSGRSRPIREFLDELKPDRGR